jgi:hypothetical protein
MTPCGFIRDCRFTSSAAVMITGEWREGSAVVRKARRREPAGFSGSILSADLDRSNPPAVAGMHAATDNVATAVIVVVVIVRVGIVSVIVAVGSEAEPYKRTSVKSASVNSSTVEGTARETSMKAATAEASST